MKLASRIQNLKPSSTLALSAKAKKMQEEGKDVVNFGVGEPDFDTPEFIKEEARLALKNGFTKYTASSGILELKEAICAKFKQDNSLTYQPKQIVISCGAKHSIFNALAVLLDKDDEVIIPSPYWVSYPEMVYFFQARPLFVNTTKENNFKLTKEEFKKHIRAKTKVLILNSPSNPTGSVYSREELAEIANLCVKNNIFVISDEIYEKLIYDGLRHYSIASLNPEIYRLTITINGVSKAYAMTGWRIGYLAADEEIAAAIAKVQDHTTSNPTSISQKASVAALKKGQDFIEKMREEFQTRRDYALSLLEKVPKISYVRPQGAFYIFCDISQSGLSSTEFANRLLEEEAVALIPGAGFGCDNFVRISFATSKETIAKGMQRLERWLKKI